MAPYVNRELKIAISIQQYFRCDLADNRYFNKVKHALSNYLRLAIALIILLAIPVAAGVQAKLGVGYLMMISVEEPLGTPSFVSRGTLYDELSPTASIMARAGVFSFGATAGFARASTIFANTQETTMRSRSLGITATYNYEMSETGEWLFPMQIEASHRWMRIEFHHPNGFSEMSGEGWEITGKLGIERVFREKYSVAFLIGRGYVWNDFDGSEFSLHPNIEFNQWRFELYTRIELFDF